MDIQFEKVGEDKVLISASDFEDIMDVLTYDMAKARDEEGFPGELVMRLIDGENPIKVFREYRGFTQTDLAKKSEISQPMLAEIEAGRKDGSTDTLKKIAAALNLDLEDIV